MAIETDALEDSFERTQRISVEAGFSLDGRRQAFEAQSIQLGFRQGRHVYSDACPVGAQGHDPNDLDVDETVVLPLALCRLLHRCCDCRESIVRFGFEIISVSQRFRLCIVDLMLPSALDPLE